MRETSSPDRERLYCAPRIAIEALPGLPMAAPGDDLVDIIAGGLARAEIALADGDVIAVTSKLVSRVEGRFAELSAVRASDRAEKLAATTGHDPRLVELILAESEAVSRAAPGVLIVRHKLGFVSANAGIDRSNAQPPDAAPGSGPWVLLLPRDPDATAARLREALIARYGAAIGVVVTDSLGRPFRLGTVGAAVGAAGLPALLDRRGDSDLFGRVLEDTEVGLADQIAAAADLVAGQADEGRAVILIRGFTFGASAQTARDLLRPAAMDLYA